MTVHRRPAKQVDRPIQPDPARGLEQHEVAGARRHLALEDAATASSASAAVATRASARLAGALGDPRAARPDRHEPIARCRAALRADLAVQALLVRPELEHVAEDGDPAPPGRRAGVSARKSSAAATLTGEAL